MENDAEGSRVPRPRPPYLAPSDRSGKGGAVGFSPGVPLLVRRGRLGSVAAVLLLAALACPIQRPPVPADYYDFRATLQAAVTDTALVELAGRPAMQSRLEARLPQLAAIVASDSLLAALRFDSLLEPLSGSVQAVLSRALEAPGVSGGVRKAFREPDGQRLAVDAILIGLGTALRRLK